MAPGGQKSNPRVNVNDSNGTMRFFNFSLIIEGATEKALKFIMPM
jgi:hypothetical protein